MSGWKWLNLGVWIAHISFLFYNEPVKNFFDVRVLTAESPPPSIGASALLAGPPPQLLPPNKPPSPPTPFWAYVLYEWPLEGYYVISQFL